MLWCRLQTKDPVEYVTVLLAMRDKYETTISRAFADDKSFRNTLNQVGEASPHGPCG
jgi:cullin 3